MKNFFPGFAVVAFTCLSITASAQKMKTVSGDLDPLKNETSFNVEFTYENMGVGKVASEKEYVDKKVAEYNKKEAGKGDTWKSNWIADREARYQPKFIELFTKTGSYTVSKDAKYTLIFKTKNIEPGYNIAGGMMVGGRKNAQIDAEVEIVETANRSKVIAVISVENAPGGSAMGYDYDAGTRISEGYAKSGKSLAKYIK